MDAYKDDKREACKYGGKCYQKNPAHLSRFKHPPTNKDEVNQNGDSPKQKNTDGKNGDALKQKNTDGKLNGGALKQKNTDTKKVNELSPPKRDIRNFFGPKVEEKNVNGKRMDREETAPLAKKIKCDSTEKDTKRSNAISSDEEEEKEPITENGTKNFKHDISSDEEELGQKSPTCESEKNKTHKDDEIGEVSETFDDILPPSPQNIRESIKQKFLVDMPEDFYQLYKFCESLDKSDPCLALSVAQLQLVGPYDVLAANIPKEKTRSAKLFLRHWRFYYDTPEFQTILTKTGDNPSQFHIGYFRDSPSDLPAFVASNSAAEGPKLYQLGDNVFAAIYNHVNGLIKAADPFSRSKLSSLQDKIKAFANDNDLSLDSRTDSMRKRDRLKLGGNIECAKFVPTFHGAGMVVPYDKKTQVGYREIPETTPALKRIFKNLVEAEDAMERDKAFDVLQELVTNVQFANDEGDPGMGLELGIDAFCYGGDILHNTILHLMGVAYDLLDRDHFGKILNAHLAKRSKSSQLNVFK